MHDASFFQVFFRIHAILKAVFKSSGLANNLISQNCPSKSKKWLYEMIPFLKIFKIPACEMIRFLKIVAFSLCLVVSFSKLHQQISKMALRNNPISQNFQNSSLLPLSKVTEKDLF